MLSLDYLLSNINNIDGVGNKTAKLFKKKNINTVFDLILTLPKDFVDRRNLTKINELQIGKIQTINVNVVKYSFPRIRNLPNRVICKDDTGEIDCIFFNSFEGYIRKILPLTTSVTISGKINYFRKKYQIINPTYVSNDMNSIKKVFSTYSLTEGLTEKKYLKIINNVLKRIPNLKEWHDENILKKFNNISWKDSLLELHSPQNSDKNAPFLKRLIFDEIMSTFLINSNIRKAVKKNKKNKKYFDSIPLEKIKKKINFELTNDQNKAIEEINKDLKSNQKMFRLLQGDVGR